MSFSDKEVAEDAEDLVQAFTIENASLGQPNLNSADFQTISDLAHNISLSEPMDTDENEIVIESNDEIEHEEEVIQTEIEPQEIEIESEEPIKRAHSPEEILPDVRVKTTTVPPLRPLTTIAPKPKQIPIAMKPVGGQQLLLLQGNGAGQAIKLVSPQGQEINLANYSLGRPITLKPTIKTMTSQGGNVSVVQQKPVVMKKIITTGQKAVAKPLTFARQGQQFVVIPKSDQQPVKILQTGGNTVASVPSPTKTITLQQAQEMGLLTNAKIVPQTQASKQTVLMNKNPSKTIKIVPQGNTSHYITNSNTKNITVNQIKSPTKILPATSGVVGNKAPQRIIFKTGTGNQTIIPTGQLIQVAGTQALASGQIHQINIPGKGMQYIKFVTTSADTNSSTTNVINSGKTMATAPTAVLSEVKPATVTSKIAPKLLPGKQTISPVNKMSQVVVVPTSYSMTTNHQPSVAKVPIPPIKHVTPVVRHTTSGDSMSPSQPTDSLDANGMRPRKPCNCTKSQCLKLYCDCFANGEFCYMCNCMNCFNNLENEDHRNRAIKACLERNPNAFRPKIGKAKDMTGDVAIRKHTKGCNCKRSGCLKNYCECYEAKIACSNNCKCVGCRNIEDSLEKKSLRLTPHLKKPLNPVLPEKLYHISKVIPCKEDLAARARRSANPRKQTINYITDDVIEATCQCLLTISDNADSTMQDDELTKREIIEEFGRCLTEIIECSTNRSLS